MSVSSEKTNYYSTIRKTCYSANIIYLVVRVFYLILFLIAGLHILAIVDGVTILFYCLFFLVLNKRKHYLYALLCGNEFFIFISVTTVMLGFGAGFHLYLIGLCVVSFFTSYFSKARNIRGSVVWVGLSLAIYLSLYFVTQNVAPYYYIDKWLETTLFVTHAIAVFAFVASYLLVFVKYALSLENRIRNESRTDELTQISNRYGLYDYFEDEDKDSTTLALFDIDDFKIVNDTYGHVVGDDILKKVAEITADTLKDDFVCRYGGEEFVIVLREGKEKTVFDKLEELRKRIEEEIFYYRQTEIRITITVGASEYRKDLTLEKWVELADVKMYAGKGAGKNQVVI